MSCRAGVEEINSTKSKIKHMATQGKNLSCMFEAQKLQMPQQSRWVPGHTTLDVCKLPTCCGHGVGECSLRMDQTRNFPWNWASSSFSIRTN